MKSGDGRECECECNTADSAHTCSWPFEGPPTTCCCGGMERLGCESSEISLIGVERDPAAHNLSPTKTEKDLNLINLHDYSPRNCLRLLIQQ